MTVNARLIESVEARTVRVPLTTAMGISGRNLGARNYTLIRITTADGLRGHGFFYVGNYAGGIGAAVVREVFAPMLVGEDCGESTRLWDDMYTAARLHGRAGTVMRALSGIDIAMWDRNARAANLPLWRYLGGACDGEVAAYASGGYYSPGKGPKELADEVAAYVAAGFDAVKIKVGGVSLVDDVERVAAARDAVGPNVKLMLDANNAWSDLPSALEAAREFAAFNPFWLEEPFEPDDVELHKMLAAVSPISVATGEIESGRRRFHELVDGGDVRFIQPDAAVCGGVTEFMRIAGYAAARGRTVWPHWFHDLHAQLLGAISNRGMVEFFPDSSVLNFRVLVDNQLSAHDGKLTLHDTPGLGFEFAEDAVQQYAVDHWH